MHVQPSIRFGDDVRALVGLGALSLTVVAAGCGGGQAGNGGPQGFPPAPVNVVVAQLTDVEDTTEYVAALKSLHSTTIQPQIEGQIVRIFVKSGDRVQEGAPLVQIDPRRQQAAVSSSQADRAAKAANVTLARSQEQRARELFNAGAISKQELEQAETALQTVEAELKSNEAQVQEREVQLRYFGVNAPTSGTVGDIPVRVGNQVTSSTLLTTIDQNETLEVYVSVPLERSHDLRMGMPIEVLSATGQSLARTTISFIASRVDEATQSVLVKGLVANPDGALRSSQFARARLIWKTPRGVRLPVVAVTRVNGQFFAYVAADGKGGGLAASQRRAEARPPVVRSRTTTWCSMGSSRATGSSCRASRSLLTALPSSSRSSRTMFVDTFIKRPILASVLALVIILAGAISIPTLPVAQYPDLAPPTVVVNAFYTGANAQAVETAVTQPIEQAINGVEGMAYMSSTSGNDGTSSVTIVFHVSRNLDVAAVDVQNRISQVEGRLPNEVKAVGISVTKVSSNFVLGAGVYAENNRYDALFLSNYLDVFVKDALKRVPGRRRRHHLRRAQVRDAAVARSGSPRRAATSTAADVVSALREQNVQVAAGQVGQTPARAGQTFQISVRAVGRLVEASQFDDIIVKQGADGTLVRVRDVGRSELGAEDYNTNLRFNGLDAMGFGVLQLPGLQLARGLQQGAGGAGAAVPALSSGPEVSRGVRHDDVRLGLDQGSAANAAGSHRARHHRDVPLPAGLADDAHSGHHDSGLAHRHLRVRQAVRLLDQHAHALRHHAGHRPRRGRCDRRHREHPAAHSRLWTERAPGGLDGDVRSDRRRHRHGARAGRGVRARGVLPGDDRSALSAVRADHRRSRWRSPRSTR